MQAFFRLLLLCFPHAKSSIALLSFQSYTCIQGNEMSFVQDCDGAHNNTAARHKGAKEQKTYEKKCLKQKGDTCAKNLSKP